MTNVNINNRDPYEIEFIRNSYGVSPLEDNTNSFMAKHVKKAMQIAEGMIKRGNKEAERQKKENSELDWTTEYNSLIVFMGDRGSGKSTVMRTFIKKIENTFSIIKKDGSMYVLPAIDPALFDGTEELADAIIKRITKIENQFEIDKNEAVHVLPVIDPTLFAGDERLVGAIVSHIFNKVKEDTSNPKILPFDPEKTKKVYERCDGVHAALRVVYTGVKKAVEDETDSLESLDKLTSSTLLQNKLRELFKAFSEWGGHKTLVIPIDDMDMKISGNYDMLEEIRSYLFTPHVLVVMAVKFEQLTDSIEQHFKKQLQGLPPRSNALDAQPAEMASKYLLKLIPAPRRIALHGLRPETLHRYKVRLYDPRHNTDTSSNPEFLVDAFLRLIWQKTGIVLVKTPSGSHGLVPANLRALNHMFDMLLMLDDVLYKKTKKCESCKDRQECERKAGRTKEIEEEHYCIASLEDNLNRIEEWVLDSACSNAVPRGLARIASTFALHSAEGLHAYLIKELDSYSAISRIQSIHDGKIIQKGLLGEDPVIKTMLAPNALPENISIGDALYVLNTLKKLNQSEGIYHFVAIMKMLYSIRMIRATHLHWSKSKAVFEDKYELLRSLLNGLVYNRPLQKSMRELIVADPCDEIEPQPEPAAPAPVF
ncbi:MAG: P-loop NTPase fold protein, partial [Defluviitaleaceae bacterium]|nr:P-loop NTPase fold protein [Defluviitaleaceae bacterium]